MCMIHSFHKATMSFRNNLELHKGKSTTFFLIKTTFGPESGYWSKFHLLLDLNFNLLGERN